MKIPPKFFLLGANGILPTISFGQIEKLKDSVVQLYGIVMTADSLKALSEATVSIKGELRATITNQQGLFHILAFKGQIIQFSYIGFKSQEVIVPNNIEGYQYCIIKTMVTDTQYLPVTIIQARPTRYRFEKDFVNINLSDSQNALAKKNTDPNTLRKLADGLPNDAGEVSGYHLAKRAESYYYSGQAPSMKIFDIPSWKKFIQAWKRGDFKK